MILNFKLLNDCHVYCSTLMHVFRKVWRDTKEVIRSHESKKNILCNDQNKRDKKTDNGLQNTTQKTKDRPIRTTLKIWWWTQGLRVGISSSCSTSDTRCVNLVTNPVISHEWVKDREVLTTSGTYRWSFVTQMFSNS